MWPFYSLSLMLMVLLTITLLDLLREHGIIHDLFHDLLPRAFSCRERGDRKQCVMHEHGLVLALLFLVFGFLRWLSPTWLLIRPVPKHFSPAALWNKESNKSPAWWHDLSYSFSLALLWFFPWLMLPDVWKANLHLLAWWVLLDIFIYHVNMFWLDELRPWKNVNKVTGVWSLRRVSVQAIISYLVTINVFAYIYGMQGNWKRSLVAATLNADNLDFPDSGLPAGSLQMLLSLILFVIVISSTASAMFSRGQIPGQDHP